MLVIPARLAFIFTFALLWLSQSAYANPSGSPLTGGSSDFLPVEEAYKLDVSIKNAELHMQWLIQPGYYLYKEKFKVFQWLDGQKPNLPLILEEGVVKFDEYEQKEVPIFHQLTLVKTALPQTPQPLFLQMRSQGCADAGLCYAPYDQYFKLDKGLLTPIRKTELPSTTSNTSLSTTSNTPASTAFAESIEPTHSLGVYIIFAFLGGIILNLMPCVFPVLSLKAMSFANTHESPSHHHAHGWAYTAGVVISFVIAALVIVVAKAAGEQSGWGFQLQSPEFVAAMAYLFLLMGLSLSGMFYFGTQLMGVGQGLTTQQGLRGSFFTGVLAALVASPCSGPFMASALGFALSQSAWVAIIIFMALGLGVAFPFLLLSYSPSLAKKLPRPGVWMEKLKEFLAFPMYASAAWLAWVFGGQVGSAGMFYLLMGAVILVMALWLWQNQPQKSVMAKRWVQGSAVLCVIVSGWMVMLGTQKPDGLWQPYSKVLIDNLKTQGHPILIDFTADWCITCKANEALALSRQGFKDAVKHYQVQLVKADWSKEDPEITQALAEFKRSGVPLYVVYSTDPNKAPEVLPQLLTQDLVIAALARAANKP